MIYLLYLIFFLTSTVDGFGPPGSPEEFIEHFNKKVGDGEIWDWKKPKNGGKTQLAEVYVPFGVPDGPKGKKRVILEVQGGPYPTGRYWYTDDHYKTFSKPHICKRDAQGLCSGKINILRYERTN